MAQYIFALVSYICSLPPTSLTPGLKYNMIASFFNGEGYSVSSQHALRDALRRAFAAMPNRKSPMIINVEISPYSSKKPQVCSHSMIAYRL